MSCSKLKFAIVKVSLTCVAAGRKWLYFILIVGLWSLSDRAWAAEQKVAEMLKTVDGLVAKGPFQADWRSLGNYQVPQWYLDAKFGIFIHWGVYSVPAFGNEWYPRDMYKKDTEEFKHHVATYGPQSQFGYKDFIPRLSAEKFDPTHWAQLFRKSGARYVVPVAEHHDGFPMYDCNFTDWCAAKMGPKRDIVGELAKAVRAEGLHLGTSSHRAEHWWFYDQGTTFDSDVLDPRYAGLYGPAQPEKGAAPSPDFLDDWLARTSEIVQKYQPELVWFDWWIEQAVFQPYLQRFAAFYYNWGAQNGKGVAINYKLKSFPENSAVWDIERGQLAAIRPFFWQTDTSISKNSWGYVQPQDYKTAGSIVGDLVDIVSKNGCLLLNIGPRPDGTIPAAEEEILLEIGRWLEVNGEAIYGTRPWKVFGEGPTKVVEGSFNDTKRQAFSSADFRFTSKAGTLYAIALAWPESGKLLIKSLASGTPYRVAKIQNVQLLGSASRLNWDLVAQGLAVELPTDKPCDHAYVLKISLP
ncbi:MAG TPA: alpha-L-fucosidase [Terriglobia bacterium]|nr:alpha-L-fucosidase [Terriglobia bacterium]